MFSLTHGHLNLLSACPRKFQYLILEQLTTPISIDQQSALDWGQQFHLLIQQQELGLEPTLFSQEDNEFNQCMAALRKAAPELFSSVQDAPRTMELFRSSEHHRSLFFHGYLLTVVYDLLILYPHRAEIIDWKTTLHPREFPSLSKDWQTKLYLFVLAETQQNLNPILTADHVRMTYWFVRPRHVSPSPDPHPQSVSIPYNRSLHEQTRRELTGLCRQLTEWLNPSLPSMSYSTLPQVNVTSGLCSTCCFAIRCQRTASSDTPVIPNLGETESLSISDIPEVILDEGAIDR